MALPKPSTPVYELTIPSTGAKVKYRPFLVKDEKALLIANQSKDHKVMIDTLKETISSCIMSKLDVDGLAIFDIEYIFCKLRAKSVGELIELALVCSSCEGKVKSTIDISTVEVEKPKDHKKKFILFDKVGVALKYPNYDLIEKLKNTETSDNVNVIFAVILECIEYIYNDDEIYYANETSPEELIEFINNLTKDQLEKITTFFNTMPKLKKDLSFDCPHCKAHNEIVLEGLSNFFQ